jgi:hypothetical protein
MGPLKFDHINRLIALTSDNVKRLTLYYHKAGFANAIPSARDLPV